MRRGWLAALLFLCACATAESYGYRAYLADKGVTQIEPAQFSHCRGYGCRHIDEDIKLSEEDWLKLKLIFLRPVKDAASERERIARAIRLFEDKVGAITGTEADVKGTYHKLGDFQHDCVDESVNTTIYLSLLEQEGLLLYHRVGVPTARVFPFSGGLGPHQTAVITEKDSGKAYAVDSWFHDNGHAPEIVPLDRWFMGWRPKG